MAVYGTLSFRLNHNMFVAHQVGCVPAALEAGEDQHVAKLDWCIATVHLEPQLGNQCGQQLHLADGLSPAILALGQRFRERGHQQRDRIPRISEAEQLG